jgi:predicted DNA binding CopG/RHH family protein
MPQGRGEADVAEAERKDRLIQTRVPRQLASTVKEEARRRRLTVSQLIRNVLEERKRRGVGDSPSLS